MSGLKRGRTVYIRVRSRPRMAERLERDCVGSAGPYPSISGMRKLYWGRDALVIKAGSYAYYMGKDVGQAIPY